MLGCYRETKSIYNWVGSLIVPLFLRSCYACSGSCVVKERGSGLLGVSHVLS